MPRLLLAARGCRLPAPPPRHPPRRRPLPPAAAASEEAPSSSSSPEELLHGLPAHLFFSQRDLPRRRRDWSCGPCLALSADEALAAQLDALHTNDRPYRDFGVEVSGGAK